MEWKPEKNVGQCVLKCVRAPSTACDTLKRLIVDLKRLKPKVRRNLPTDVVGEKIPVNSLHHEIPENPFTHLSPVTKPIKRKLDKQFPAMERNSRCAKLFGDMGQLGHLEEKFRFAKVRQTALRERHLVAQQTSLLVSQIAFNLERKGNICYCDSEVN